MKEILKDLGSHIRSLGFKGSGQNFRKLEEDFVFVINIQGSSSGKDFYVNLGAQPTFIPTKCDRPLATLKEYQCVLRTRVGVRWEWSLDEQALDALKREIELTQREFLAWRARCAPRSRKTPSISCSTSSRWETLHCTWLVQLPPLVTPTKPRPWSNAGFQRPGSAHLV